MTWTWRSNYVLLLPIRGGDQPPVSHIAPIFSIWRDCEIFVPCCQPSILWCHYCMTSYVFQAFAPPFFQSNWLVTSDVRFTVMLIRSFSRQFSSESILLRHKWELSTPASEIISFSRLCSFLCLSRSVLNRALFSWPFQFGIWCLCYNYHQLISAIRDTWIVRPPTFVHHPL